jgi:hypothetical protein
MSDGAKTYIITYKSGLAKAYYSIYQIKKYKIKIGLNPFPDPKA